uniref:Serpentine Receptor, class T n=1 Tax=Haemonchus contortus TaxID=6289 RepID=A0A7I4YMG2_HAECO
MENTKSTQYYERPYLFTVNSNPEAVTIGIIYSSLAFAMIPFYCIFNWVMWTDPEIKNMSMYRLMNHINFIDFLQLLCHFVSGFFAIYPEIIQRSRFFSSFIGSTVNSLWQAMFPYLFVLSISRILIIKKRMDPNKLSLPMLVILIVGWLFTITVWLWSWFGMAFVFGRVGWEYDFSMWSSPYLKFIELGWCVPTILSSYLIYLGIIVHFVLSKRHVSSGRSHRHEILIFCQATFLNGWMLGLMTSWHGSALLGFTEDYHQCVINCIWILFSYLNPILLIVLNKTVRRKFLQFVTFRKMTSPSPTQTIITVQSQSRVATIG